jgi:signal transduction histidine kinase
MDDFFNDSMHELKTPLGVINSNLELISKNAQNSKHIQRMRSAAKQMWMTYEDIEYYIKHKAITYDKEIVNFSEYLKFRIEFFQDIALPKSITVESAVEPDIFMNINKTQLQRLIDNNISNAIKYSFYKGKIKIILKKTKNGFAIFSVCDQGIGIENVKNIFKRFKREDNTQGGFGLGLSIVQNICDQNKIKIYVKSPKGRGSIFKYAFKTPTI